MFPASAENRLKPDRERVPAIRFSLGESAGAWGGARMPAMGDYRLRGQNSSRSSARVRRGVFDGEDVGAAANGDDADGAADVASA